jgi:uncharacterized protein YukE
MKVGHMNNKMYGISSQGMRKLSLDLLEYSEEFMKIKEKLDNIEERLRGCFVGEGPNNYNNSLKAFNNNLTYLSKNIKNYSCKEIDRLINDSDDMKKKIFNGIGLYEEPYTAMYFYHGGNICKLTTIPFNVTTGSGRSKGDYTIVLKPL